MNLTTVYKLRSIWQNTHLRLLKSCIEISSGFTCMMKNLYPGPLMKGSVDLDKFPASKVHQLAKKYESSKATARHIKQVAGEKQATQIHLM